MGGTDLSRRRRVRAGTCKGLNRREALCHLRSKAATQMFQIRGGFRGATRGVAHQIARVHLAALRVDVRAQPLQERGVVCFFKGGCNHGVSHRFVEQLRCIEVPEGVGRKVAEAAHAPVDVLKTTAGVIRRGESEEVLKTFVPGRGNVCHFEGAVEEAALQFEPQKNVQIVGGFVGFDADEGKLGPVDRLEKIAHGNLFEIWKQFCGPWQPFLPEGFGAAHVVFPQTRLGLVDAKRHGGAGGKPKVIGGQALLIQTVSRLVEDSEQGGCEVGGVVACGEADVVRTEGGTERVGGRVNASGFEIESKASGNFLVQLLLFFDG